MLRRLRYPIKFYLLTTLCVALLAAFAADRLAGRRLSRRQTAALVAFGVLFVAAHAVAGEGGLLEQRVRPLLAGLAAPASALLPAIRHTFAVDAVLGLAAAALVAAILLVRVGAPACGYLLGFATFFFALPWGLPLFVSADERDLERPPAVLASLDGPGRLFISPLPAGVQPAPDGDRAPADGAARLPLARVQIEELIPDTGQVFGVRYLFDADPDGSYGYYNRLVGEAYAASAAPERGRLLRAFGARWILASETEPYPLARARTGLTVAGRRLVLLERREAGRRAALGRPRVPTALAVRRARARPLRALRPRDGRGAAGSRGPRRREARRRAPS